MATILAEQAKRALRANKGLTTNQQFLLEQIAKDKSKDTQWAAAENAYWDLFSLMSAFPVKPGAEDEYLLFLEKHHSHILYAIGVTNQNEAMQDVIQQHSLDMRMVNFFSKPEHAKGLFKYLNRYVAKHRLDASTPLPLSIDLSQLAAPIKQTYQSHFEQNQHKRGNRYFKGLKKVILSLGYSLYKAIYGSSNTVIDSALKVSKIAPEEDSAHSQSTKSTNTSSSNSRSSSPRQLEPSKPPRPIASAPGIDDPVQNQTTIEAHDKPKDRGTSTLPISPDRQSASHLEPLIQSMSSIAQLDSHVLPSLTQDAPLASLLDISGVPSSVNKSEAATHHNVDANSAESPVDNIERHSSIGESKSLTVSDTLETLSSTLTGKLSPTHDALLDVDAVSPSQSPFIKSLQLSSLSRMVESQPSPYRYNTPKQQRRASDQGNDSSSSAASSLAVSPVSSKDSGWDKQITAYHHSPRGPEASVANLLGFFSTPASLNKSYNSFDISPAPGVISPVPVWEAPARQDSALENSFDMSPAHGVNLSSSSSLGISPVPVRGAPTRQDDSALENSFDMSPAPSATQRDITVDFFIPNSSFTG